MAKKLRFFGFDTLYIPHTDDNLILKINANKERIILTNDKLLYSRSSKLEIPCLLINLDTEIDNIIFIMKKCNINKIYLAINDLTRCTICNGSLNTNLKNTELFNIPKKVLENNPTFFRCTSCKKIYWNGTHVKEINFYIEKINKVLNTKN